MKVLAIIFISGLLALTGAAQSTKTRPRPVIPQQKSTPAKAPVAKKTSTPVKTKAADAKNKSVAKTTKPASDKKGPAPKSKTVPPNPTSTGQKTKTVAAKPKPKPVKPSVDPAQAETDEEAEYEKASTVADGAARIAALRKFIKAYPKAKRAPDAANQIVTVQTQLGNDRLTDADIEGAVGFYKKAIADAPKPITDQLFTETLAKFPANLYFRGARAEGFELAKAIEAKTKSSVSQMLAIATFYMSVENGSEARRVAENAIKLDPASGAAYQTLGLASRMDFLLDESAAAYAKALELEPESASARRGLAEMKRPLGKADEAVALYREIIAKDEANLPARTGLVLALFDAGQRTDAEAELGKALEANPGNVILQASAAYWYAANNEGEKAVELAQKAIASDPRFIWSHIALARGYIAQRNPVAAEKTLLAARRYGNFPTLEYEIASARAAAGFYREAADELAKSFVVKDGLTYTDLGGRIKRGSKDLAELIGFERKASIFAPASSDGPEFAAQMTSLLELKQELDKAAPNPAVVGRAADDFVHGDDKMKVHRIVFAGSQLLNKNVALSKVVDLTKSAPQNLDAGLEVADPTAAVMASELYESRTIAATRGDYVNIPVVPRTTLSAVLRGRVEEINGWAHYQLDDPAQASVHLKRAVSVLPADSAWWRSSTWRLGTSLAVEGKNAEALEMFIRSYKSSAPDALKYNAIETLYKRVNGHTMGLENRIGANPSPTVPVQTVAQRPTSTPSIPVASSKPTPEIAQAETTTTSVSKEPETVPEVIAKPTVEPSPTPESVAAAKPVVEEPVSTPSPSATPEPSPTIAPTPAETPKTAVEEVKADPSPTPERTPEPTPAPTQITEEPKPTPSSTPEPTREPTPAPTQITEEPKPTPSPTPESTREPAPTTVAKETPATRLTDNTNGLFPPVIINIPPPPKAVVKAEPTPKPKETVEEPKPDKPETTTEEKAEPKPAETKQALDGRPRVIVGAPVTEEIKPCTIALDQDTISLQGSGNERAIVVRRTDDGDIDGLSASSTSPDDVSIRREPLPGVKWTALFVLRSVSAKPGVFQIKFEAPCGTKDVRVRVR